MCYRLGLVLFAFDAFISVVHDESPNVRADELNLHFPSPEFLFAATSEAEWKNLQQLHGQDSSTALTVSFFLSSLLHDAELATPLPNTLMGRFVLLHGNNNPTTI